MDANRQYNRGLTFLALTAVALMALLAYFPGLSGPFLFDDHSHIRLNEQVHIKDLSADSISRAWHSSYAKPPSNRPLAQLTFGINHAFSGLSTFAFKSTNLFIHLINGILLFLLSRNLLQAALSDKPTLPTANRMNLFAVTVAAIWLLHPLNLTSVLYIVQRMTSLSALFVLAGLWLYVSGRLATAKGKQNGWWLIVSAFPVALIGILAKENAVLFPVLLLTLEMTLLRHLVTPRPKPAWRLVLGLGILMPILVGALYLYMNPALLSYNGRDFDMTERLMSQARALWFYLQLFVLPDYSQMALFHDDFPVSRSLWSPLGTAFAIAAWMGVLVVSLLVSKRFPILAFSFLFYLAAHLLESSFIPLEMVFEHRNYLALIGPVFALAWLLTLHEHPSLSPRILGVMAVAVVLGLATLTFLRASDWKSKTEWIVSEVENHPESKRANFHAAQLAMQWLENHEQVDQVYQLARSHFEKILSIDTNNPDALFGLIILNLHVQRAPESEWVDNLEYELSNGAIDASRFTVSQFSFLVRWHLAGAYPMPEGAMTRLFDAVEKNRRLGNPARAGILAARSAYVDRVLKQPEKALPFAKGAVRYWPQRWHYRKRYAQLLMRLQRWEEAVAVLQQGIEQPLAENQRQEALHLVEAAESRRQGRLD